VSSYRALLARTGARAVAFSCALGWLSFSSYGLAIVLAVQAATGSFAVAGAAVGAFSAGAALLAPVRGRFVDRRGPRAVAVFAAPHAAALALLVLGCAASHSAALLVASAALAGACVPPLIATARSLWPAVAGPQLARAGHALNAVLGDLARVAGPALTGALAALPLGALRDRQRRAVAVVGSGGRTAPRRPALPRRRGRAGGLPPALRARPDARGDQRRPARRRRRLRAAERRVFELLDEIVDRGRAVEALTWLTSAQGAGLAAGAAAAGALAHGGAVGMLALAALAAVVAAAVACGRRAALEP